MLRCNMSDTENKTKRWHFSRQLDISVLIQLVFLATLIVGTWVNLQNQLSLMQHDITRLLETQKQFQQRIEELSRTSITYEYRLRAIERRLPDADIGKDGAM
jgi:uncharacterized membrane protein (DUF106 family)